MIIYIFAYTYLCRYRPRSIEVQFVSEFLCLTYTVVSAFTGVCCKDVAPELLELIVLLLSEFIDREFVCIRRGLAGSPLRDGLFRIVCLVVPDEHIHGRQLVYLHIPVFVHVRLRILPNPGRCITECDITVNLVHCIV